MAGTRTLRSWAILLQLGVADLRPQLSLLQLGFVLDLLPVYVFKLSWGKVLGDYWQLT